MEERLDIWTGIEKEDLEELLLGGEEIHLQEANEGEDEQIKSFIIRELKKSYTEKIKSSF